MFLLMLGICYILTGLITHSGVLAGFGVLMFLAGIVGAKPVRSRFRSLTHRLCSKTLPDAGRVQQRTYWSGSGSMDSSRSSTCRSAMALCAPILLIRGMRSNSLECRSAASSNGRRAFLAASVKHRAVCSIPKTRKEKTWHKLPDSPRPDC